MAQNRVRPLSVVILDPKLDLDPRTSEAHEQYLVEQLVAQEAIGSASGRIHNSHLPVLHRLA